MSLSTAYIIKQTYLSRRIVLYCILYTVLYGAVLYCTVLHCLYCIVILCAVYSIVLCCAVLHSAVLYILCCVGVLALSVSLY